MRKALLLCLFLAVVGVAWVGGWYMRTVDASREHADQFVAWAKDQKNIPVEFVVSVPPETPGDQVLYISGDSADLGDWDAAGVPMKKADDGKYHAIVNLLSGVSHDFKITRGTWGTVERGAGGAEVANHSFIGKENQPVEVSVLTWVDNGKAIPGQRTLTGIFREHKKFVSKYLGNNREIIVYMPPGYDTDTAARYPVLYMQDGENLFDASTSFAGVEWRVDETAQSLISSKRISPVIIVGIYNTPTRSQEFSPFDQTAAGDPGQGTLYGKFVVEEVKPMIDQTYRTMPDKAHTAIAGSSMGGMIALAIAHDHSDVFGSVAVLDPWLTDGKHSLFDLWKDDAWMKGMRFYVDMGTNGGPQYPTTTEVQDAKTLVGHFDAAGLKQGSDYLFTIIDGAAHNEAAWQQRVGDFLTFLYGASTGTGT